MTTRGSGGRTAVTHYEVRERIESPYGKFALIDVRIETGRTHQIRVHMASIGHPVVGDTLYGAAGVLRSSAAPRKASRKRTTADPPETRARLSTRSPSPQPQLPARGRRRTHTPALRPAIGVYRSAPRGVDHLPQQASPARNRYNDCPDADHFGSFLKLFNDLGWPRPKRSPGCESAAAALGTVDHQVSPQAGNAAREHHSRASSSDDSGPNTSPRSTKPFTAAGSRHWHTRRSGQSALNHRGASPTKPFAGPACRR